MPSIPAPELPPSNLKLASSYWLPCGQDALLEPTPLGLEELMPAAHRHAGELHHVAVETNFLKSQ